MVWYIVHGSVNCTLCSVQLSVEEGASDAGGFLQHLASRGGRKFNGSHRQKEGGRTQVERKKEARGRKKEARGRSKEARG